MKTIICGGRDYELNVRDFIKLEKLRHIITEVVSGGARGVDTAGEVWAKANKIPVRRFPADWDQLGKNAGFERNAQMADYADTCVAFSGGKETAHMLGLAQQRGLKVFDFRDAGDLFSGV